MAVNSCKAFDEVTAWNSMSNKGNSKTDLIQLSIGNCMIKTPGSDLLLDSPTEVQSSDINSLKNSESSVRKQLISEENSINCNNNNSSNQSDTVIDSRNSSSSNKESSSSVDLQVASEEEKSKPDQGGELNSQSFSDMTTLTTTTSISDHTPPSLEASLNHLKAKYSGVSPPLTTNSSNSELLTSDDKKGVALDPTAAMKQDDGNINSSVVTVSKENGSNNNDSAAAADAPSPVKINDPSLIEDRFRVDRRKLEQMLQGMYVCMYVACWWHNLF